MTTGWIWHELYMWHDTGHAASWVPPGPTVEPEPHVDNPAAKRRFRNLVEVSGLLDHLLTLRPREATEAELLRFHTAEYIERIRMLSDSVGGDAGEYAPFGRGGFAIAALAAGGCIAAVDAVLNGVVDNVYALVRPPGHHAESDRGRGSCIFGNVVLAAMHARQARGLGRVAIVDWDVHHGNSAQLAFWSDPTVLTISLHQERFYPPDSGSVGEVGAGAGKGFNLNVPLPPGSGEGAYLTACERIVVPALQAFRPELVLVASGLDANAIDPQGRMLLHSDTFRRMTRILVEVATEASGGRLVLCHEGGYSSAYVPFCGLAIVEELAGISTGVEDPFLPVFANAAGQGLEPHQEAAVAAAAAAAAAQPGLGH